MAVCPKCSHHVKVYQMSPYCKKCGVHLMFASFEGQFEKDRRIAEMSMAFFRYTMAKIKSAYVSGLPQKIKIVAAVFPLIALLLPLGQMSINTPVYSSSLTFNIIDLFVGPFIGNGLFGKLDLLSQGPVFGEIASSLKTLIIVYALIAVSAVLILLIEIFSFIGNKKVCISSAIFSVTGIVGCILTKVFSSSLIASCNNAGSLASASSGIMFIFGIILFAVPLFAAVWCLKCPPVVNFREGDELRVEYRRKYKKGEIDLLSIPAPIYESEEDKKERKKLVSEAYNISEEEEVTVNE